MRSPDLNPKLFFMRFKRDVWSNFNIIDKIFFWLCIAAFVLAQLVFLPYGSLLFALSTFGILVSPVLFLWGLLKILKSRKLMGQIVLASIAIFLVGTLGSIAVEPQKYKDETQARLAEESRLQEEIDSRNSLLTDEEDAEIEGEYPDGEKAGDPEPRASNEDNTAPEVASPTEEETNQEPTSLTTEYRSEVEDKPANLASDAQKELDTVTRVIDGDTIHTSKYKIRIIGINTPETKDPRKPIQCFGVEASKRMAELVEGKDVYLEVDQTQDTKDRYSRDLRNVYLKDGTNVAYQLIREGYGYEYTYNLPYMWQAEYKAAQKYASDNKLGLWADDACSNDVVTSDGSDTVEKSLDKDVAIKIEDPKVMGLKTVADKIVVSGYGIPGEYISILLANGDRYQANAGDDGSFTLELPEGVSPYGSIELQSVSGFWLFKSFESLHDKYYYSMFDEEEKLRTKPYEPVITAVNNKSGTHEIKGYYLPETKLLVKHGDEVLAKNETNSRGEFKFESVKFSDRYSAIEIKTYTQWLFFGVTEKDSLSKTYVDSKSNKTYSKLPTRTETITKTEPIKFESISKNDNSLEKGKTKISQEGKPGKTVITYEVTYEGNEKIKTVEVSRKTSVQPTNEVKSIGTYVKPVQTAPAPTPTPRPATPTAPAESSGSVKMSSSGICHAPGTTYYNRTTNFTPYSSISACIGAGGRLPLR